MSPGTRPNGLMQRKTYRHARRAKVAVVQREHLEQRYFFALLQTHERRYPVLAYWYSVPNGARVGPAQASKLVREGLKKGCPDTMFPVARGGYIGAAFEFKAPRDPVVGKGRGYPSDHQRRWLCFLLEQGYFCAVVDDRKIAFDLALAYVRGEVKRSERPAAVEQHRRT